jgi:hypothetical protein
MDEAISSEMASHPTIQQSSTDSLLSNKLLKIAKPAT